MWDRLATVKKRKFFKFFDANRININDYTDLLNYRKKALKRMLGKTILMYIKKLRKMLGFDDIMIQYMSQKEGEELITKEY